MDEALNDERFMRAALREARRALGQTSPNPAVGAVLVENNRVVARGHHRRAGDLHAEVDCIRNYGRTISARSTMYVTLEPCSTEGRTPPCVSEIIHAGIRNVVIGAIDVNPRHSGRAVSILQNTGINVRIGVLENECAALNEAFNKWIVTRKPFVIAKCGMSLDGRLTRPPGESQWITSTSARRNALQLRAAVDAILVGAETIRRDNPRLTSRLPGKGKQPWRVIISRSGTLPKRAHVLTDRFAERTVVYRGRSLSSVLEDLGRKEITSVLIEGGGDTLGQALDQRLIDKLELYVGPLFTGGPVLAFPGNGADSTAHGARLRGVSYRKIDNDICVTGYPVYGETPSE